MATGCLLYLLSWTNGIPDFASSHGRMLVFDPSNFHCRYLSVLVILSVGYTTGFGGQLLAWRLRLTFLP